MRKTLMVRLVGAAASVLTITGCADTATRLGYADQTTLYYPELISYAAPKGEITTVVEGNPFGGTVGNPEAIAAAIKPPAPYNKLRFTTSPGPGTPSNYRLVLVFDPPAGTPSGDVACNEKSPNPGRVSSGPVTVQASFCIGSHLASQVVGSGAAASGPEAPAFQDLMAQVMQNMFPPVKRDIGDSAPILQ